MMHDLWTGHQALSNARGDSTAKSHAMSHTGQHFTFNLLLIAAAIGVIVFGTQILPILSLRLKVQISGFY